jgi:hypothetical protein
MDGDRVRLATEALFTKGRVFLGRESFVRRNTNRDLQPSVKSVKAFPTFAAVAWMAAQRIKPTEFHLCYVAVG